MLVYVVLGIEKWDGKPEIVRIYNNMESAELFVEIYENCWDSLSISEWNVED